MGNKPHVTAERVISKYIGYGFLAKVIDSGFRDYFKTHLDESDLGLNSLSKEYNAGGIDVTLYIFDGTMDVVFRGYNEYGEITEDFLVLGVSNGVSDSFDGLYENRFTDKDKSIPNFELRVLEYDEESTNQSLIRASELGEATRKLQEAKRVKYRELSDLVKVIEQ